MFELQCKSFSARKAITIHLPQNKTKKKKKKKSKKKKKKKHKKNTKKKKKKKTAVPDDIPERNIWGSTPEMRIIL